MVSKTDYESPVRQPISPEDLERLRRSLITKHAAPIHPGTGTDQSAHGSSGGLGDDLTMELERTEEGSGSIEVHKTPKGKGTLVAGMKWSMGSVSYVGVQPEYRRRGIATAMFRQAREMDPGLKHGMVLSEDAKAWVATLDSDEQEQIQKIMKRGGLSPAFGNRSKRQAKLIRRLKQRRKYGKPVRGGKKKKGAKKPVLTRGRSATTLGRVRKHAAPIHPGTGTDQSVHGSGGSLTGHTTAGEANQIAADIRQSNEFINQIEGDLTYEDVAARHAYDKYSSAWDSLPDLPGERTFWTRPHLIDDITTEVKRLNSRGQRYFDISEQDGLTLTTLDRTHTYTWIDGTTIGFQAIEITGQEPNIEGFDFLGKIEHLQNEGGSYTNILKVAPQFRDQEGAIPKQYRDAGPNCDICQRNIYRKETFLVRNQETGEIVQAGRDDLQSYTGYSEADQFANFTSKWADLKSQLESGPGGNMGGDGPPTYDLITTLAVADKIVQERGFVRSSEMGATKEFMGEMLRRDRKVLDLIGEPGEQNYERAEKIQAWLNGLDEEQLNNDYLWNLKTAGTNPYGADARQFGLLASAPTAYDREMGLIVERERKVNLDAQSDWIGEIKERRDFKGLTVTRKNSFEGAYGTTYVYEFLDNDNNQLVWFASNPIERKIPLSPDLVESWKQYYPQVPESDYFEHTPVEIGERIDLKATVKEHKLDTYNDRNRKQTVITRGKIIETLESQE